MRKNKYKAYRIGRLAEHLAAFYLKVKFYRVIKRRYKCSVGEIDILAVKNKTLVAVEVKFRRSKENALQTIHTKNKRRVARALEHFIVHNPYYSTYDLRFDAIAITWPLTIQHLDNAWENGA